MHTKEYCNISAPSCVKTIVCVDNMKEFILRTKDKDYVLDFQRLLEDYGIEVE